MISPKEQKTIQIDITNACPHQCSNCTRFCGWHEKSFFMDEPTFRKAVESLKDFPGMVGIIGGEPTLHPEFEKFVNILLENTPNDELPKQLIVPEDDMNTFREKYLSDLEHSKRGLYSCLGPGYKKHFNLINRAFRYQCLNDHKNVGEHQALLLPRKELGIPDDEWIQLRDNCWIQTKWSASITPKGAFFCEVAAALDMLFDGPGGWPIEPGWWLRRPSEFGKQLDWCEYCSGCLPVPGKPGQDEVDIISPEMAEKLGNRNAPKAKQHRYEIFTQEDFKHCDCKMNEVSDPYIRVMDYDHGRCNERYLKRVSLENNPLVPEKICVGARNDDFSHVPEGGSWQKISLKDLDKFEEWLLFFNQIPPMRQDFEKMLRTRVYNPEIFYLGDGWSFVSRKFFDAFGMDALLNPIENLFANEICYAGTFKAPTEEVSFAFLIPVFNCEKTVEKALDGVLHQDYGNFQVYIVDDGSTDHSWELIQGIQQAYPEKIHAVRFPENRSTLYARMELVEMVMEDYSIWLDADDEVNTNFCSFAAFALREYPVEILEFPSRTNNVGSIKNYGFRDEGFQYLEGRDVFDYFCFEKKSQYVLWSKVFKTDLLKRSKLPEDTVPVRFVEDMVIDFPIYWNAKSYVSLNSERMYTYNFGNGSWGRETVSLEKFKENCIGIRRAYDENYKFFLKNVPEFKYFEKVFGKSRVMPMYSDVYRMKPEERFEAMAFYKELFPDNSL